MRRRVITCAVFACVLLGCSGADDAASDDSLAPTAPLATGSGVAAQPTTIASTLQSSTSTIASPPEVADTAREPEPPGKSTVSSDGTVSWEFTSSAIDSRFRRYVLDAPSEGFDEVEVDEATSDSQVAHSVSGIFATEGLVDPYITVTVTTPDRASATPTLDGVTGEPTSVGDAPAVRRTLGVNGAGLAFVVGEHRVDVVAKGGAEEWLEPLAASVAIDGSSVSARAPDGSGLRFVGAISPATPVADGFDLIGLFHQAQGTGVRYSNGEAVIVLSVTSGRVVDLESLTASFEPRAEPIKVAGQRGWVVRSPQYGFTQVSWAADGRMFFVVGNLPEDELLALAAGVRPATAAEWSQLTN